MRHKPKSLRPLSIAGVVVASWLGASGAWAASGGITSPQDGTVFTGNGLVSLRAQVGSPASGSTQLRLQGPSDKSARVVDERPSGSSGSLSYDLNTSCATYPSGNCRGVAYAVNGTYVISMTGGVTDQRSFSLTIPPQVPDGAGATRHGSSVSVSWHEGAEPDLTGWSVYDGGDHLVARGISPNACHSGSCAVQVAPTGDGGYRVRAYRRACPGCSRLLQSDLSGTVHAGAGPSPAPSPSGGSSPAPSASPGPGGGRPGGGHPAPTDVAALRAAQRAAFARAFGAPTATHGLTPEELAPQPAYITAPVPEDGAFSPTLGYQPLVQSTRVSIHATAPSRSRTGGPQLIATALLLVLAGGHLRSWMRHPRN